MRSQFQYISYDSSIFCFSENLRAVQCVQSRIEKDHNERCSYNSTFSVVWLKRYYDQNSIVEMLRTSGFPGSDCGGKELCFKI